MKKKEQTTELKRPDLGDLRRTDRARRVEKPVPEPAPVSSGPLDKVIDFAFNPSRNKLREVTVIDMVQGRLFPQLDMVIAGRKYIMDVAQYRFNPDLWRMQQEDAGLLLEQPVMPDLLDEFLFRTAQWQKSISGLNLAKATEMAMAEIQARGDGYDEAGSDPFRHGD